MCVEQVASSALLSPETSARSDAQCSTYVDVVITSANVVFIKMFYTDTCSPYMQFAVLNSEEQCSKCKTPQCSAGCAEECTLPANGSIRVPGASLASATRPRAPLACAVHPYWSCNFYRFLFTILHFGPRYQFKLYVLGPFGVLCASLLSHFFLQFLFLFPLLLTTAIRMTISQIRSQIVAMVHGQGNSRRNIQSRSKCHLKKTIVCYTEQKKTANVYLLFKVNFDK